MSDQHRRKEEEEEKKGDEEEETKQELSSSENNSGDVHVAPTSGKEAAASLWARKKKNTHTKRFVPSYDDDNSVTVGHNDVRHFIESEGDYELKRNKLGHRFRHFGSSVSSASANKKKIFKHTDELFRSAKKLEKAGKGNITVHNFPARTGRGKTMLGGPYYGSQRGVFRQIVYTLVNEEEDAQEKLYHWEPKQEETHKLVKTKKGLTVKTKRVPGKKTASRRQQQIKIAAEQEEEKAAAGTGKTPQKSHKAHKNMGRKKKAYLRKLEEEKRTQALHSGEYVLLEQQMGDRVSKFNASRKAQKFPFGMEQSVGSYHNKFWSSKEHRAKKHEKKRLVHNILKHKT